jgi:hypothetical protein
MNSLDNAFAKADPAQPRRRYKTAWLWLGLIMLAGGALSACTSKPVEETVTTSAGRSAAVPANSAQSLAITPDLPARDADLETAGDRIAEAITHLDKRRHGGHEAALRALGQAEAAMNRALRAKARDERASRALHAVLRDIETAERNVQRGTADTIAAKQLTELNKDLDELVTQSPPEPVVPANNQTPSQQLP